MSSPFLLPNFVQYYSKLFVPIKGTNLIQDDVGNWVLPDAGEQEFLVFFKQPTDETEYLARKGLDSEAVELEGYLVQPMFFPANFQPPERIKCIMKTPNQSEIEGEFLLKFTPASSVGADIVTGQKIQGVFTTNR